MSQIPCALIIVLSVEVPYSTVSGVPVKNAIRAAGVTVTSTKNVTWNLPRATGGRTCVLSDAAGNNITISTQSFDSDDSRDAAIQMYNANPIGRGRPAGSLIVPGSQLVYITPAGSEIIKEIGAEPVSRPGLK